MLKQLYCVLLSVFVLNACTMNANNFAIDKHQAVRDLQEYAIASCLFNQESPFLRDQGDSWASAIIQRSRGALEHFTAVADVVKAEVSKGNMVVVRAENEPGHEKPLPIAYCVALLDTVSVRDAVNKAAKKIESAY